MKTFKYDVLINEEDICDREHEIKTLINAAHNNKKIVLLAPRRYGKTSLVKNVIGNKMEHSHPKRLVIFADLMGAESLQSISARLEHALTKSMLKLFTVNNLAKRASDFFKHISLQINVDPTTGATSLVFKKTSNNDHKHLMDILDDLYLLTKKQPVTLILDEFQDIALIPEAAALFRSILQQINDAAVFILGSKRHLMQSLLNNSNAPLFHFGDEMHLQPIPESAWIPYFKERLKPKKISLTKDGLHYLLERMCQVPNAICELGAWIQEHFHNKKLTIIDIEQALGQMVEAKQSYAYRVNGLTRKEKLFLQAIAKENYVTEPHSQQFLSLIEISKSGVGNMLKKFQNKGMLELELDKGWRLADPVFAHYLRRTAI